MEGKELLRLLDFVGELRKAGDKFEGASSEVIDSPVTIEWKTMAKTCREIAERLEKLLRELNS